MKILKLCFLLLMTLLMSCSVSPEVEPALIQKTSEPFLPPSIENGVYAPENVFNTYDEAGWLHNAVFEAYYDGTLKDTSLAGIIGEVNRLVNENSHFVQLSTSVYHFDGIAKTCAVLNSPILFRSTTISSSLSNADVAAGFTQFLNDIEALSITESDYGLIYAAIIAYEANVMKDVRITAHDLEVILTTTSVLRYSTLKRKKRPKKNTDPEWDLLIANVTGAVSGATESMQEAVAFSLILGIYANR